MGDGGGVNYGAFIGPGLVMLSPLGESISNARYGIYLPKSVMLGVLILITARAFVPYPIEHQVWM